MKCLDRSHLLYILRLAYISSDIPQISSFVPSLCAVPSLSIESPRPSSGPIPVDLAGKCLNHSKLIKGSQIENRSANPLCGSNQNRQTRESKFTIVRPYWQIFPLNVIMCLSLCLLIILKSTSPGMKLVTPAGFFVSQFFLVVSL